MKLPQILIVEDETLVAEDIKSHLADMDYKVNAMATSGEEALLLLEDKKPDLILMDIVLAGGIDGIETARIIKEKYNIPVIFLTAYTDKEKVSRAQLTEPYGYLVKPFDEREVQTTVAIALYKAMSDRKLRDSRRWARGVLHSISDAVITTDMNGHVRYINPSAQFLTGWSAKDAANRSLHEVVTINDDILRQQLDEAIALSSRNVGESGYELHFDLLHRNGNVIPVSAIITGIQYEDGESHGIVLTFRDISIQRQVYEMLRQMNADLEHRVVERTYELEQAKLIAEFKARELEGYSYSIAHDLRSPLRSIVSFSQILFEDTKNKLNKDEQKMLTRVINAGKNMALLIDDILELAWISRKEINRSVIDLTSLCREIIALKKECLSARSIDWKVEEGLAVNGDEKLISVMISNLIDNACKYTRDTQEAIIEIGSSMQVDGKTYFLRDNGIGFDNSDNQKIFKVFHRLHHSDEYEGTGVGLARVQRIVELHQGKVWAEGKKGLGSTFYFTFGVND